MCVQKSGHNLNQLLWKTYFSVLCDIFPPENIPSLKMKTKFKNIIFIELAIDLHFLHSIYLHGRN